MQMNNLKVLNFETHQTWFVEKVGKMFFATRFGDKTCLGRGFTIEAAIKKCEANYRSLEKTTRS